MYSDVRAKSPIQNDENLINIKKEGLFFHELQQDKICKKLKTRSKRVL